MGNLLLSVLPLALAAAVTPTLFALQVLVVSGPAWPPRARAVVFGSGAVFLVVFALAIAGLSQLPDAGTGHTTSIEYRIEFIAGVLLIPAAIWMLLPHQRADAKLEKKVEGYANHASVWVFAGLGAYMSITDFSTLVLLVPALHQVTQSDVEIIGKAFVLVFLYACVMAPVLVPPFAVRVLGEKGIRAMHRVYKLVLDHQIQVMGVIAVPLAIVLITRSAPHLFG